MTKIHTTRGINQTIADFVESQVKSGLVHQTDRIYLANRLAALLKVDALENLSPSDRKNTALELLDELINYAVSTDQIEDLPSSKDVFGAKVMDLITPAPSQVNLQFWENYRQSPKKATDQFFGLSRQTNYIKTREIAKNIEYTHETDYGELEITINLSKPEKDPKEIARAGKKKPNYPKCMLCMENEGYEGHLSHPGRANHRIIRMTVGEEDWGFQYSPYAYYDEHCIFLSHAHREMNVGIQAVRNLMDILTVLPHYFVGSNAGLPIVGGSILSHDHYQGGRHTFPLERAEERFSFELDGMTDVKAAVIKWPMSVIRITSESKNSLIKAAEKVMSVWEGYSDESVDLLSETDGVPHNAVTPIARRKGEAFELDLVLRNNRTSESYPDGIFHPHPPVQHIKKENIGLIEVMGLAILPPRLKDELNQVRDYLLGRVDAVDPVHQSWADELKIEHEITEETVGNIVDKAVGEVFLQVLKDAGVFKTDHNGKEAFKRFITHLKKV
ncbi:UDP-glucose--hexose-1-phosphate uridylyltransferase [Alkalibacterium sp. s-m-22]|uniref:Galactose-1-phosphate uridylyltransferase n=1 Tax=Alkalibacterium indicireducens TaxID=398758 RepID=A0ABP3KMC9_9LACT